MLLYLHPMRHEAVTTSETLLTRWSLATTPATILAQVTTAPGLVFTSLYDPGGRLLSFGGVAPTADGEFIVLQQPAQRASPVQAPCAIAWYQWDDLRPARTFVVPQTNYDISSLHCSPDGRWLVIGNTDQVCLLDQSTGNLQSRHRIGGYASSGLAFDPTSSFVAGLSYADGEGELMLWQLTPAKHFIPRPMVQDWPSRQLIPQDELSGVMALTLVHEGLDRRGITWPDRDLADTACITVFSPDSRLVVFHLMSSYSHCRMELVAYEVLSGKRLWCIRSMQATGPGLFSPGGSLLLVPEYSGNIGVYRIEDGVLVQRLPTGMSEPIQALCFDHDGNTLWLATKEMLIQYYPQG